MANLDKEFEFYIKKQQDLLKQYNGKVLVIKDCQVIGSYNTEMEALKNTQTKHKLGTFLIQKCEPGKDSYTIIFHSKVVFA